MGKEKRPFCCHQNLVPKGLSAPALVLYTCIKALKCIPGPGVRWAFIGPLVLWCWFCHEAAHLCYSSCCHRKKIIEKSREFHKQKPQPTPDTKRMRKRTKIYACKINKQMHEKQMDPFPLPQAGWSQCQKDWRNTATKSKAKMKRPSRSINQKATHDKTKPEWSVA